MNKLLSRALWAAVIVAAVAALVIGATSGSPPHQTMQQRVYSLAGQFRCPVCDGESAAESNTPPSVEIRNQIESWLKAGQNSSQIKSEMVASYGPGILEKPQAKGVSLLVWLLPIIGFVAAAAGLAFAFVRWRRSSANSVASEADRDLVDKAALQ